MNLNPEANCHGVLSCGWYC